MTRHHIAMGIASAVVFAAAMVMLAIGPSDADAERATAASVQDAIEAARIEAASAHIAAHRQARAEFFPIATTTESTK